MTKVIRVWVVLLIALTGGLFAQMQKMNASQVVSFIQTSAKKFPDKDVAGYLKKVSMTDRLSDDAIESCIQAGAGPHTRAALMELANKSAALPVAKKVIPDEAAAASLRLPDSPSAFDRGEESSARGGHRLRPQLRQEPAEFYLYAIHAALRRYDECGELSFDRYSRREPCRIRTARRLCSEDGQ